MMNRIALAFLVLYSSASYHDIAYGQDDYRIWNEFIKALRGGTMSVDKIRPHKQLGDKYKSILLGFLDSARTQASSEDWTAKPEVERIENRTLYIVPWTTRGQKTSYCFSFVTEDSQWYFQHLEAIFVRLDRIARLPVSDFPDVSEAQKNWAREEIYWSFVVTSVYLPVAREKGIEYALTMLKDGVGYFVGAQTWVPFVPPQKSFVLYLCWEQAKLRGNNVTLVKLEENDAIVRLNTHFFALYFAAAHLKPVISLDDYRQIFETIWQDRASNAGWQVDIQYSPDYEVTFHLTRTF